MTEYIIPKLPGYDSSTLDAEFQKLAAQVEEESVMLATDDGREAFRLHWLGRKQGRLKLISDAWLKTAPNDKKGAVGQRFNELKVQIEARIGVSKLRPIVDRLSQVEKEHFKTQAIEIHREKQTELVEARRIRDITLPGVAQRIGAEHPLIRTMAEIVTVFERMGYSVGLGPEVESDFYNFEALNFPPNHPARDTQDTLVVAGQDAKPGRDRLLMRTHTSPVQIRSMLDQAPPLRLVIPGKVHRNDAADATHSPVFHQVEGLCVDTNITFSDLKGTLDHAMKAFFGSSVKTRFFPSFFPFTEPSADVQISCIFCGGNGCRKCKHSGWIELLGCGMVDPAVFEAVNKRSIELGREPVYDTRRISGFAFGMGVDRIAMMKYGISDIGLLYSGDMRFLEQFA
ncbi:MAG TPA: phenylalanine--tRNA ligase subunit alpha [Acidobacteriaceae bacterium]